MNDTCPYLELHKLSQSYMVKAMSGRESRLDYQELEKLRAELKPEREKCTCEF